MYAIVADYYHWDSEKEEEYTKPCYLGAIYPPVNVYVFDEDFNDRSYRFKSKDEAEQYLKDHPNLTENLYTYSNIYIVEIKIG